jgi:aspartate racemase
MNRIIMNELAYSIFEPQSVAHFRRAIDNVKNKGCDPVLLGCTEIPLIIDEANSPLPTLDSTRLLARAALRHASNLPVSS